MNGRRTQTTLPDGTSWRYGYDRLSQVVSGERVNTDGTPVQDGSFRYEYDGIGNRTFSQDGAPNAIRRYSSNALNQYTAIAATGFIPLGGRADEDANVVVTATVDGRSETYLPAREGQEFSVDIPVDNSRGAVTATVRVDALKPGHAQSSDLHRSLAGEYTIPAAVPETPSYDADGNMLSNDGWTYAWNAQDRLVSAAKGAIRLEFAYDCMGRRFEKKVYENNVLTKRSLYAYDGFKQIAEYDALDNNALLNTYLWQPEGLDVPLLRNGSEFYVSDANKNVVALMDTTGAVTDTYVYDPFGNCAHTGDSTNPFRFSSEYHDDETDLVYYNYRYYSPELGRWTKRDPIGEEGGVNVYCFVCNQANIKMDSMGLVCCGGKTLKDNQCCHKGNLVNLDNDIVRDANCECRIKLSRVYKTEKWLGFHKNICVDGICFSFGLKKDSGPLAGLLAHGSDNYAKVYIPDPNDYKETDQEILVRKTFGKRLKKELRILEKTGIGKGLYSIFVFNLGENNKMLINNCLTFTSYYWNLSLEHKYENDIPPESPSFIPLWRKQMH